MTLGSRAKPAPPLLRLPPVIRRHIYRFLGLASWNGSPYGFDLNGPRRQVSWLAWAWEEQNPNDFHGILLSCRDLHAETAALLYSANRFILYYTNPGSLQPLFALTPMALSSLASLKVVLNQASCHQRIQNHDGRDCCLYQCDWHSSAVSSTCERQFHSREHQPPLLSPAPEGDDDPSEATRALLGEWQAAASHLSPYVTPGRLELSLVCDIDPKHEQAVELARSALGPLLLFPLLRSCHIRLCKTPDSRLRQLAQDAVLQSTGLSAPYAKPTSTRSTLVTLPRELRLRILELTDLVTPSKEVWWSRDNPKYVWWDMGGTGHCVDNAWSDCQFNACWHRTRTRIRAHGGSSIGCFCHRRHAAFSASCTCWAAPGPALFLICRTLYRDAQLVFFTTNRFVVHDFRMLPPFSMPHPRRGNSEIVIVNYPLKRLAASQFLREVVPAHCLAHLRFLELVFPPYLPSTWPGTDHPAMRDWWETVGWLRDKINGPALTLRLVVTEHKYDAPGGDNPIITAAEGAIVHRAYMDLLQPLKQLAEGTDGLSRFYADLRYPWERTAESLEARPEDDEPNWFREEKKALKKTAERYVMGDRYDSVYANDKEEPKHSLWQHVTYRHF
ncbi:uncharacterized protein B0H64DRAFT_402507 [Chaetomium fimeti]|uniref:F-box domain-containing protein n=1 Tax=Chaetomium fimeti TaxID=1854472 RepID=A0AAE0HES2_9PEZI|nr:hypothetical protein B0H64DRAFT_402507 [Chaetomium fimeti]